MQKYFYLSLKEGRTIFSIDFGSADKQKITAEEVLLEASDITARASSREKVIKVKCDTDPSTMCLRTSPESPEDVA